MKAEYETLVKTVWASDNMEEVAKDIAKLVGEGWTSCGTVAGNGDSCHVMFTKRKTKSGAKTAFSHSTLYHELTQRFPELLREIEEGKSKQGLDRFLEIRPFHSDEFAKAILPHAKKVAEAVWPIRPDLVRTHMTASQVAILLVRAYLEGQKSRMPEDHI